MLRAGARRFSLPTRNQRVERELLRRVTGWAAVVGDKAPKRAFIECRAGHEMRPGGEVNLVARLLGRRRLDARPDRRYHEAVLGVEALVPARDLLDRRVRHVSAVVGDASAVLAGCTQAWP